MIFKFRSEQMNKYLQKKTPAFILSALILGLVVLLTACATTTENSVSSAPTAIPSPAIDPTLTKQGDMELQAFQQWIALIKQYNGDITSYHQQYRRDHQALHSAHSHSHFTK